MSAIVATQRIVGGKISGDGKNDTLSQRDLDLICQLLDIENPDSLPTGEKCRYLLTLETIEARESGRGLAIVRDLVREWRGHLVVRPDAQPFTKIVGACFPL